jgi:hypothetical protein
MLTKSDTSETDASGVMNGDMCVTQLHGHISMEHVGRVLEVCGGVSGVCEVVHA